MKEENNVVKSRKKDKDSKVGKKRKSTSSTSAPNEDHQTGTKRAKKPPKRAKDRNKNKKNKKKNKNETSKDADVDDNHETVGQNKAVRYLDAWAAQKDGSDDGQTEWKFNKCRQILLLQHCYDKKWISDEKFDNLLCYIDSIRGEKVRKSVKDEAQKIVDLAEAWSKAKEQNSDDGEEDKEQKKDEDIQKELGAPQPPGFKVDRAKDIVELLST